MRRDWPGRAAACIGCLLLHGAASADDELVFRGGLLIPSVDFPRAVTAADVDEDGLTDLVIGGVDLEILYADGAGGFTSTVLPTGGVSSVLVADIVGNGHPDVVAAVGESLEIHINLGGGQLVGPLFIFIDGEVIAMDAGDFDGDDDIDIAVVDKDNDRVLVVFNAGDGLPESIDVLVAGQSPVDVVAADLDDDGISDVVATDGAADTVTVALGAEGGAFDISTINSVEAPFPVSAGDLDGNGTIDLAIADFAGDDAVVLLNDGTGAFGAPMVIELEGDMNGDLLLEDLDGDLDLDVISTGAQMRVIENLGGAFGQPQTYDIGSSGQAATIDISGDGAPDLVLLVGGIASLFNDGDGGFLVNQTSPVPDTPVVLVAADLDNDGTDELVIGHSLVQGPDFTDAISTHEVGEDGLTLLHDMSEPKLRDFDLGDLTGDGIPDLALVTSEFQMAARQGAGDGSFPTDLVALPVTGNVDVATVAIADMNLDGAADIVTASPANFKALFIEVFENNGAGSFGVPIFNTFDLYLPRVLRVGDLNGDDAPDVVLVGLSNNADVAGVFINDGDGELTELQEVVLGSVTVDAEIADVDMDGDLDLVTASCFDDRIEIWSNDGTGQFADPVFLPVPKCSLDVTVADFNNDGVPDVASSTDVDAVVIWLGEGEMAFCQHPSVSSRSQQLGVLGFDVDGDEDDDLLVANRSSNTVMLAVSEPAGSCVADFNGDGALDILDFVAFQNAFITQDPDADCDGDGMFSVLDFVCFQNAFSAGCE